ncbi:mll2425 [Mesorhizobium japonicum MAFF 303099]|uniref:Mll2425 protein n=1 Tax=Mesorhizobium japonicum (strain LMG 29417 / CECT 9101 / MAFF 303099) TaxID=266835 RepID=Q98IF6_RHILO|nr:mll2425 [Mesorhizobium japonicum MAFF 303099]
MYDGEYFDGIPADAIGDDIGDIDQDELSRRFDTSNATHGRLLCEQFGSGQDARNDTAGRFRTVFLDMRADFVKPAQCPLGPADCLVAHNQPAGLIYLAITAANSCSLANSPRSASANPASISASCHSWRVTKSSMAWAAT